MFLNPNLIEEQDETEQQQITNSKMQPKQRTSMNRFQAKPKNEVQQESKPLNRIQQREMEIQKKIEESKPPEQESLVQFDSDSDEDQAVLQKMIESQEQQQLLHILLTIVEEPSHKENVVVNTQNKELQLGYLQNNSQYVKKLGQNESVYQKDEEIEIDKFAIIGNNQNQYYEPGQTNNEDQQLPSLSKQNNKIQFDSDKGQEIKTLCQTTIQHEESQQIQDQSPIIESPKNSDENIIMQQDDDQQLQESILQSQQKEEEVKKELKQQHEKIQMADTLEQHEENQNQIEQQQQQQQIQQEEFKQKQTCPYPKPLIMIEMPLGKKHFLLNPAPKGGMIQCTIKRDRGGMNRFYPKYHMHISNGFLYLMSAKKRACNNTSNYIISLAREDMQKECNFIGKVRSNFMGTEFVLYDAGKNPEKTKDIAQCRSQLGIVQYESNILGSKGPRKMVVLLPRLDEKEQPFIFKPSNSKEGIIKDYQSGMIDFIETYVNRPPQWNSKHKAFVLNFYQRVDKPSVKNFQLIIDGKEDNILLQFGRVGDDLFNIDFQYPITPLQAFQIALTSFDYKIACE